jgi:hypothetical protein
VLELNSKGDEEIFPAILNYMYTGKIEFSCKGFDSGVTGDRTGLDSTQLNVTNTLYYLVGEITLTLANVVHIIIIADRLLMAALKKKAVKYLERMLKPCIAHEVSVEPSANKHPYYYDNYKEIYPNSDNDFLFRISVYG